MKTQHLFLCLLGILALTKIADADEVNFGKKRPSTNQVLEALKPSANPDTVKSRSISKKTIHQEVQRASTEAAMSMEIFFGYNSAELTDLAKDYLKPVGEAMASEKLQDLHFVVEGHTDAIGGDAYNKNLSEERADSVKRFLVDTYHIAPSRIQSIGKGKSELLDPKNPESEVNRRVRIVAKK